MRHVLVLLLAVFMFCFVAFVSYRRVQECMTSPTPRLPRETPAADTPSWDIPFLPPF
jgi:hypothetical protein